MQRTNIVGRLGAPYILLICLVALVAGGIVADAQTMAPRQAAGEYSAYLPLVINSGPQGQPEQPEEPEQPTNRGGFFTLTDYLTYSAATAVDGNGGVHLAFFVSDERHEDSPLGSPALYAYCPGPVTACADANNWGNLVQFSSSVNEVQIAVTADGRPRLLVRRNGSAHNEYEYYACEQQCSEGGSWSGLYITNAAGADINGFTLGQHYFALDSQGRPRFIYGNGWGNGQPDGIYYAFCDEADCTAPGSWVLGRALVGPADRTTSGESASLVFDGDKPRAVIRVSTSGLPTGVIYLACDFDCESPSSWSSVELPYPGDRMWGSWDLALDAAGRPHVALYEPAPVDITVGGNLYYLTCGAADCTNPGAWQQTLVASGEGRNADIGIDPQGRLHMVYDGGQRGVLIALKCAGGCASPAKWQREVLETTEQLFAEFPVPNPPSCSRTEQAWLDAIPTLTFDQAGNRIIAYDVKNVATCYYVDPTDPTRPPGSRVERLWWAVRWAYFSQ